MTLKDIYKKNIYNIEEFYENAKSLSDKPENLSLYLNDFFNSNLLKFEFIYDTDGQCGLSINLNGFRIYLIKYEDAKYIFKDTCLLLNSMAFYKNKDKWMAFLDKSNEGVFFSYMTDISTDTIAFFENNDIDLLFYYLSRTTGI